ncbi:MAG: MBL fold metallo-hydrolase, partial [bacterium]|nr:MBL fold metallo-hydrolase [bacterium]
MRALLVDCGPTTLPMLKGMDFDMEKIDLVLLTHLHGDHIAGIPFLFLEYQYGTKRDRPFTVAGPPGTEEVCEALYQSCYPGTAEKSGRKFDVRYRTLREGETAQIEEIRVRTERMIHGSHVIPYGYRIEWQGKAIGWSGDTEWTEALTRLAEGTDLFICECFTAGREIPGHLSAEVLEGEVHQLK